MMQHMDKINNKDVQFAKALAEHKGEWVALKDDRIIAFGKNVEDVQNSAEMENIKDYILHLVPTRRLAMPL
jgi:hypothetical protein